MFVDPEEESPKLESRSACPELADAIEGLKLALPSCVAWASCQTSRLASGLRV